MIFAVLVAIFAVHYYYGQPCVDSAASTYMASHKRRRSAASQLSDLVNVVGVSGYALEKS